MACLSLDFCWVGPRGRIINLTGRIIEQPGVGVLSLEGLLACRQNRGFGNGDRYGFYKHIFKLAQ